MLEQKQSWTEKYRPKTFNDIVIKDKERLKKAFENGRIHHILLVSKQGGTGKGSFVSVIKEMPRGDFFELDCSVDGNKETISNLVETVTTTYNLNGSDRKKVLFLDETRSISPQAMETLKIPIEKSTERCMFILATNDDSNITDALRSRFIVIDFSNPPKKDILNRLKYICESENVKYEVENLNKIIEKFYPSMRDMINHMEFYQDELDIIDEDKNDSIDIDTLGKWIWKNYIIKENVSGIKAYANKNSLSYNMIVQSINVPARVKKVNDIRLNELIVNTYKKMNGNNQDDEFLFDEFIVKLGKIIFKK